MAIDDPNRIYDGFTSVIRGMDGGRRAHLIDPTQVAFADNCIFREGSPTQRPPLLTATLNFVNPDLAYTAGGQRRTDIASQGRNQFLLGNFQGAHYYSRGTDTGNIMATINGRLYQITPRANTAVDIFEIGMDFRNGAAIEMNYMAQAGRYLIVQDGQAQPIIFDGVQARRSVSDEIQTGLMMGVGMGRIVLVSNNGDINFGNIYDGEGNGDLDMLKFTEATFLNEGFASRVPAFMGMPTAVGFLPQQDTATGVGECLVFAQRGVESFFLSIPRDQWKNSSFQRTALLGHGCTGHRALCLTNDDYWMRSLDGVRSYRQARAQIDKWAQVPMSTEVKLWLNADTKSRLDRCSMISFNNRILATCTPVLNPLGLSLYHNGLVALDFDVLSSFGADSGPSWDGHWGERTGNPLSDPSVSPRILQLVEGLFDGEHRAFAFVINSLGHNAIREIPAEASGKDFDGPITARFRSRSMDWQGQGQQGQGQFELKSLYSGDLFVDRVEISTDFEVTYAADQKEVFSPWDSFTVEPIDPVVEGDAEVVKEGYDPRHPLRKPDESNDPVSGNFNRNGYEFQVEIAMTGRASIRKFRAHAQQIIEASGPNE